MTNHYLWDKNQTRYQLIKSELGKNYNWLFIPGGPGADSQYYLPLIEATSLPGNSWLIDLPGNGDNIPDGFSASYDFKQWFDQLIDVVKMFENPILVGHSFGGIMALLLPQLEKMLSGLVLLCAAPKLWFEAAAQEAQKKNLPSLDEPMQEFIMNPSQITFDRALQACVPYYFAPDSIEEGAKIFEQLPFNYRVAQWGMHWSTQQNYEAAWVPEKLPSLILGGSDDSMVPFDLFLNDTRFNRKNIFLQKIVNAGHAPWLEQPEAVAHAFKKYVDVYLNV